LSNQGSDMVVDDVDVAAAWEGLNSGPCSRLVDLRTRAEWTYVGIPDLGPIGKRAVLVEWQTFPDQTVDARFVERLAASSRRSACSCTTTSILFAVREAVAWQQPEQWRRRGTGLATTSLAVSKDRLTICGTEAPLGGWKATGLPWQQG
jgi:hypothetical protein